MGPYCNYCQCRCFVPFPEGTPQHVADAYNEKSGKGVNITIIATCPQGQAVEKSRIGYCYDDIKAMLAQPAQPARPAPEPTHPADWPRCGTFDEDPDEGAR